MINAKCKDFEVCSRNSDAKCFRIRHSYSKKLIVKNNSICDLCAYKNRLYIEIEEDLQEYNVSIPNNEIQKMFEKFGLNLEEDNNAAELCDLIVKRLREKLDSQETFFDGKNYTCCKDRLHHLIKRILHEEG